MEGGIAEGGKGSGERIVRVEKGKRREGAGNGGVWGKDNVEVYLYSEAEKR